MESHAQDGQTVCECVAYLAHSSTYMRSEDKAEEVKGEGNGVDGELTM